MPRTKQTFRQKTPSRDEVAQALVVASVKMHHDIAPSTPDLSAERCASLVDWIGKAHGGELFLRPVDWQGLGLHDYLSIIQHPIDLSVVSRYCRSDAFEFAGFQDMIRLVWANACRYNPSGTFVHNLARRLAALTEDVIIDAQEHPVDDEKTRVSNVYFPVVSTLLQCHVFAPFVAAVEPDLAPGYSDIVRRPMCLDEIASKLEKCEYCSRYDVERDGVRRPLPLLSLSLSLTHSFVFSLTPMSVCSHPRLHERCRVQSVGAPVLPALLRPAFARDASDGCRASRHGRKVPGHERDATAAVRQHLGAIESSEARAHEPARHRVPRLD